LEKFRGLNVKIRQPRIFVIRGIILLKKNVYNRFTGPWFHRCMKHQSLVSRSTAEIKWVKGYSPLLIMAAGGGSVSSELTPHTGAVT
jgi:hypothetical protein